MNLDNFTKNVENVYISTGETPFRDYPNECPSVQEPTVPRTLLPSYRIISFDVGIKNMAYCIFEVLGNSFSIIDWNVISMMNQETPNIFCNYIISKTLPKKSKKEPIPYKKCGKQAKYNKGECYYCETHAKKQIEWIIPKKTIQPTSLKKMKIDELLEICYNYSIIPRLGENEKIPTKKSVLEKMCEFFNKKCLTLLVKSNDPTASDTDLITIGRNMKKILDTINDFDKITHVIIENQMSPMASRMKTVQGMLTQYFIMKYENMIIEYISASNKLKGFVPRNHETENTYKQHKSDSVFYTSLILDVNPTIQSWSNVLLNKKKDDFCDAFLQGLWYLKSRNIITLEQYIIKLKC